LFLACEQNAYTAYNPFEPDVIKVTNTATIDINVSPQAEFNNINTTPIFNTDSNVFTSITTNGVFCVAGTYLVDVVLYHESTAQRSNQALEVTVNSVSTGIRGANGYIRSISTNHREATTTVADVVQLTTTSKIGFDTLRLTEGSTGAVAAPAGQSSMRIVRVDDR
jgi:hypothetical protein